MADNIKRKRLSSRYPAASPIDKSDLNDLENDTLNKSISNDTPRRRTLGNRIVLGNIDTNSNTPNNRISLSNRTNIRTVIQPTKQLDVTQLSSLYSTCIKLASTNKITQKNTWGLHLIDHMSEVIQRDVTVDSTLDTDEYSSELQSTQSGQNRYGDELTNFQKASATLDASMQIYSHRVDYVHTQTYKVLGGLSSNPNAIEEEKSNETDEAAAQDGSSPAAKKKKQRKGIATIETKLHNINIKESEHDLCCEIDPLYQKYTALFDDGHVSGLLLNNISVYNHINLVFDSSVVVNQSDDTTAETEKHTYNKHAFDLTEIKDTFLNTIDNDLNKLNDIEICYDMPKFRHMLQCIEQGKEYKPDEYINTAPIQSAIQATDNDSDSEEYGIGLSDIALPEKQSIDYDTVNDTDIDYVLNKENELYMNDNMDDMDDHSNADYNTENSPQRQQPAQPVQRQQVSLLQQLGLDLGESDDIFSNHISNWAGVSHWRYNKPNFTVNANKAASKPKKKKQQQILNFFDLTVPDSKLFSIPTKSTITLPERSDEELHADIAANKLPIDIQYTAKQLQQLFLKPTVLVRLPGKKSNIANNDNNAMMSSDAVIASTLYSAPQIVINDENAAYTQTNNVENSDAGTAENDSDGLAFADENTVAPTDAATEDTNADEAANNDEYEGNDDHLGDLMTVDDNENISLIEKPQQAEKMNIEYARVAKRVDVKVLKHNIWQQLHTIKPIEQNADNKVLSFQSSVNKLNTMYNESTLSALSIPYCFICVLHLANEHSLVLQHKSDDPKNNDYLGDLNVIIPNSITVNSVGQH